MGRIIIVMLLGLAACAASEPAEQAGPVDVQGWRLASGKMPSRAEYAAVVAACQERAGGSAQAKPLDACLAELGLTRTASR
jgi:hypothetical protein